MQDFINGNSIYVNTTVLQCNFLLNTLHLLQNPCLAFSFNEAKKKKAPIHKKLTNEKRRCLLNTQ